MIAANEAWCQQGVVWWLQRNPLYLLSAACMAIGARLYLVGPDSPAGDVGVILITLGALQVYEWAVTAILLVLRRWRRAPEDEPSLLLVAALFWTGPLAATIEMTAEHPRVGALLAAGVVIFALLELAVVRRSLLLPISGAARLVAAACLLLLLVAPPLLRVVDADGTNDLLLYFCWWLLGAFALGLIGCVREQIPDGYPTCASRPPRRYVLEMLFVTLVLAATATHLYAMNYAFLGHARAFYVGPLLLASAAAAWEHRLRRGVPRLAPVGLTIALPIVAVALAAQPFDPAACAHLLPTPLSDPLLTMLLGATAVWWIGAWRGPSALLVHLGSAALALSVVRAGTLGVIAPPRPLPLPLDEALSVGLLVGVGYLMLVSLLRRSRAEIVAALIMIPVATVTLVEQHPLALAVVAISAGWCLLAIVHLLLRRPTLALTLTPVALLALAAWGLEAQREQVWAARANTLLLVLVLWWIGRYRGLSHYRAVAGGLLGVNLAAAGIVTLLRGQQPVAAAVVAASFVLLVSGATVSWHKQRLLAWLNVRGAPASRLE